MWVITVVKSIHKVRLPRDEEADTCYVGVSVGCLLSVACVLCCVGVCVGCLLSADCVIVPLCCVNVSVGCLLSVACVIVSLCCVGVSAGCLVSAECLLSLCCVCLGLVFDIRKMETEKYLQVLK